MPCRWMDSIGMLYTSDLALLKAANIVGALLKDIDDGDLVDFGIARRFERKRFLRAVRELKQGQAR